MSNEMVKKEEIGLIIPKEYDLTQVAESNKWVTLDKGTVIEGLLCGCYTMEDKKNGKRDYYLIRTLRDVKVEYKDDDGVTTEGVATRGDMVCLGARSKLDWVKALCNDGKIWIVYIEAIKEIKIPGGHTLWLFNSGKREIKRPDSDNTVPF